MPGQSPLALVENGLDERGRIVGAEGKRPIIRNVPREAAEAFRKQVEIVNLIGCEAPGEVLAAAVRCAGRDPGPVEPFAVRRAIPRSAARRSGRLALDPAGYAVIFPDMKNRTLILEHYHNDGVLDYVLEGRPPLELYATSIEMGLVTRLDHAAYLGQELAPAHYALLTGSPLIQDAPPGDEPPPPSPPAADPAAAGHT